MKRDYKHLAEWGKTKSWPLNSIAQQATIMVDTLFDVLQAMRDRPASPQAQAYAAELAAFPGDTQWTEYYYNQDELCYDFCSMILYAKGFPEDKIKDILSLIFILLRMPKLDAGQLETITPSELAEGHKFLADTLNSLLESISGDLHRRFSGEDDPEPIGGYMNLMRCPAVKFVICVFLPCAASFHTTPGILLQNAVNGDEKALERLLIIDKHALTIPGVAAIYHDRMATDFKRCQNTIAKYLTKSPPIVTKRKLKQVLGTLLYTLMGNVEKQLRKADDTALTAKARELNSLTITDVQELFTAFARDSGTIASHESDPDVNDSDALRQAIHRIRKEMPPLPGQ